MGSHVANAPRRFKWLKPTHDSDAVVQSTNHLNSVHLTRSVEATLWTHYLHYYSLPQPKFDLGELARGPAPLEDMFTTKAASFGAARTGIIVVGGGAELATPTFMVGTCRGAVPHLTPDHAPAAPIAGVYAEELWDRDGLVDSVVGRSSLPLRTQVLLGAARRPGSRKIVNKPNSSAAVGIDTTQGSRLAPLARLLDFMVELAPDMFLVPYDAPAQSTGGKIGGNRLRKMESRSLEWARQFAARRAEAQLPCTLIAQVPPELCRDDYIREISAVCDAYCFTSSEVAGPEQSAGSGKSNAASLASVAQTLDAARLRLSDVAQNSWAAVVDAVGAGTDVVYVPIERYSERGLALRVRFDGQAPEYADLNDEEYKTDMTQLGSTEHALAYIHHMLEAREMTAQVLLQQHNFAVVSDLFRDMRQAIEDGSFAEQAAAFKERYT